MMSRLLVSMAASLRLLMNSSRCSKLNNCSCSATTNRWRLLGMVLPCMRRMDDTFTARLRRTKWIGPYSEGGNAWACWLLPHGRNRSCLSRPCRTDCGEILCHEDLGEAKDSLLFGYLMVHLSYYYEVMANWHLKWSLQKSILKVRLYRFLPVGLPISTLLQSLSWGLFDHVHSMIFSN